MIVFEIVGSFGAVCMLLAYWLSARKIIPQQHLYFGLNLVGSVAVLASTIYAGAIAATVLNAVWATVALLKLLERKPAVTS